jgi:hypothetical protein
MGLTVMADLARLLLDTLKRKDVLSEIEVENVEQELTERLKLKNILTQEELTDTSAALHNLRLPKPTGWAHAGWTHAQRLGFSAGRTAGGFES